MRGDTSKLFPDQRTGRRIEFGKMTIRLIEGETTVAEITTLSVERYHRVLLHARNWMVGKIEWKRDYEH